MSYPPGRGLQFGHSGHRRGRGALYQADMLCGILERGVREGVFRDGIDAVDLYITIASLCYFPISNAHTLRAVFENPIDEAWLDRRTQDAEELVIRFLRA